MEHPAFRELARIWKEGCILSARFFYRINKVYGRDRALADLIVDPEFARNMVERQAAWRVVKLAIEAGLYSGYVCQPCLLLTLMNELISLRSPHRVV